MDLPSASLRGEPAAASPPRQQIAYRSLCQGRTYPPAQEFLERKQAEGKSRREALRCLKRHLARRVWRLLVDSEIDQSTSSTVDPQRGSLASQIAAVA